MEASSMIIAGLFFIFVISLVLLYFGNTWHEPDEETEVIKTRAVKTTETKNKSYPHMPSPPPHITRGMQRAPSLNSPYPASPPPLGFEFTTTLPTPTETVQSPLPYPLGEIAEMPRPIDLTNFRPPPNEWSYIEEQVVRDVARDAPSIHPPSYEEALSEGSTVRNRHQM
ncbi:hypothetical protein PPYR_00646 [Photinus pyralis]|uniref:Uncharacterized protein n=1 Tax=Photinus pyralis TaxID=7054 RepID=A0A1Y1MVQ7_PHOPY|nr:uncharacterized protein LOC116172091 [Photinus pyralis]KAB0803676.1 hypothetical protein PPYR_00646 [Photinus pyralis]